MSNIPNGLKRLEFTGLNGTGKNIYENSKLKSGTRYRLPWRFLIHMGFNLLGS